MKKLAGRFLFGFGISLCIAAMIIRRLPDDPGPTVTLTILGVGAAFCLAGGAMLKKIGDM